MVLIYGGAVLRTVAGAFGGYGSLATKLNSAHVQSQTYVDVLSAKAEGGDSFDLAENGKMNFSANGQAKATIVDLKTDTSVKLPIINTQCDVKGQVGFGGSAAVTAGYKSYKTKDGGSAVVSVKVKPRVNVSGDIDCYPINPAAITNKGP